MMHKQDGLAKIRKDDAPFNHYETKCGIHANYDNVAFLWTNVTCKECLTSKPIKATRKTNDVISNERKSKLIKAIKELKRLRYTHNQMVLELQRMDIRTQTDREINDSNLEAFMRRNDL
jgi:hypothetical protein